MSKILNHPDKEEIIDKLSNGESVRSMEAWLKEKYPNNRKLHISSVSLQKFRKNKLQLEGQVLKDIQEGERTKKQMLTEQERQKQLESSNAYKKKINEIVDSKLDVARRILQLDRIMEARIEYWFNAVASGEETAAKGDKELRSFMDSMMTLMGQYKKFVEGMADKTVDYNVNVTVMNEQIVAIQDVIRECIAELEPDQAILFMDRLQNKLSETSYRPKLIEPVSLEDLDDDEDIE